ncbi:hypothetical protein [Marinimicrobium agarilyticum]|uniref:hypothetical protein n=1 Tax=Marinimicrobium agarilyticum TaxID=306546 RepID=UPI0004896074|nr:hypothetical protein [Marinimicrobium agarilyticum]
MYRMKIWGLGYSPMILGIIISIFAGVGIGQVVMVASIITVPVAIKMEQSILEVQGVNYENGSPAGNFLAKILGAIFICGALWLFGAMVINIVRLNA